MRCASTRARIASYDGGLRMAALSASSAASCAAVGGVASISCSRREQASSSAAFLVCCQSPVQLRAVAVGPTVAVARYSESDSVTSIVAGLQCRVAASR